MRLSEQVKGGKRVFRVGIKIDWVNGRVLSQMEAMREEGRGGICMFRPFSHN